MKKLVIAAAVSAIAFASPAIANTASTVINASISPICTVSAPGAEAVTLGGPKFIGDVKFQCNNSGGFTASVISANVNKLKALDGNNATFYAYDISVGEYTNLNLNGSAVLIGTDLFITEKSLPINVDVHNATGPAYAGTYQDILTFSIVEN